MSGPRAVDVVSRVLAPPVAIARQESHTVRRVRVIDPERGQTLDEALCTVMRGPGSYTGEDVVELSCHGSPALLAIVVEHLCRAGARLAAPGEFTRRAFVNGRIDLARAEAVALLIGAQSARAVTAAARATSGELSTRLARLRHALLDIMAGLEVALDFPDDAVGIATDDARCRTEQLADEASALARATRRGRRVHDGVTVAIVGRTNAGKSSLFNALVGRNRAIVSPEPGTTRDVIEATIEIGGLAVRLLDTAGLGVPHDGVEAEGMLRSHAAIEESDVVLRVIDGSVPPDGSTLDLPGRSVIVVRSKSDLPPCPSTPDMPASVVVSTLTGEGLDDLLEALLRALVGRADLDREEGPVAATLRQQATLEHLAATLGSARSAFDDFPLEVGLVDLQEALRDVSALLGVDIGDDVLDRVFATFCVGK